MVGAFPYNIILQDKSLSFKLVVLYAFLYYRLFTLYCIIDATIVIVPIFFTINSIKSV